MKKLRTRNSKYFSPKYAKAINHMTNKALEKDNGNEDTMEQLQMMILVSFKKELISIQERVDATGDVDFVVNDLEEYGFTKEAIENLLANIVVSNKKTSNNAGIQSYMSGCSPL